MSDIMSAVWLESAVADMSVKSELMSYVDHYQTADFHMCFVYYTGYYSYSKTPYCTVN